MGVSVPLETPASASAGLQSELQQDGTIEDLQRRPAGANAPRSLQQRAGTISRAMTLATSNPFSRSLSSRYPRCIG